MNSYVAPSIVGELPKGLKGFRVLAGSADAENVVVLAVYPQGRAVIVSGNPGPIFDSVDQLQLGKAGSSVVYVGIKGGKHHVVFNGAISAGFDWVGKLYLSLDGKSVAYPTMRFNSDRQEYRMMVNGTRSEIFDCIGTAAWHPQGLGLAYACGAEGVEQVVAQGQRLPAFERVRGLQFSPEGRMYYWGLQGGNWWLCNENGPIVCSEGEASPAFGALAFGRDGTSVFWFCKRRKWFVCYGAHTYGPWAGFQPIVGSPKLSNDFRSVTYVVEERARARVCRNEVAGCEFDAVGKPVTQDGLVAYKARLGKSEFLIINGAKQKAYSTHRPEQAEDATYLEDTPVISSTGDRIACIASSGTDNRVVVNGDEHRGYRRINGQLRFSNGSNHLVYGAQNGQQQFVHVDSEPIGPFEEVFSAKGPSGLMLWDWCPEFSEQGDELRFFCVEGRRILKCGVKL